jgi:heme A synthase
MPLTYMGLTTLFLGKPIMVWGGILLLFLLVFQVLIAFLNLRMNNSTIPFSVHRALGYVILLLALAHAFLGLAAYFP